MQIKMYFFVKNIVLLFLFTPNDPENGKNCRLLRFWHNGITSDF